MTGSILLKWHDYKYFPYEREFARREIASLFGAVPLEQSDGIVVPRTTKTEQLVKRLTYTRAADIGSGSLHVPLQTLLEGSALVTSLSQSESFSAPLLRRQQTRYSSHGLHEYRGKYNPQVVRALGNIFGLEAGSLVLDPFCGSGTTLLECLHNGWNAVGVDANPLAVFIANAKVSAIREIDRGLLDVADQTLARIQSRAGDISHDHAVRRSALDRIAGRGWIEKLPNSEYLRGWFPLPVLAQLAVSLQEIRRARRVGQRNVLLALLSDTLREASYQDPGDLRIRRRSNPAANYPLVKKLIAISAERLARAERARSAILLKSTVQRAHLGDSRHWLLRRSSSERHNDQFDAVISSPPYANALPYIDTQRLSLCALGLVAASNLRKMEGSLIGNREIPTSERDAGEVEIANNASDMPDLIATLCRTMLIASRGPNNGFRRRNTPVLTYRYFSQMGRVFGALRSQVRRNAPIGLIVGRNRATLGDREFAIDTPILLSEVAQSVGMKVLEIVELDAYFRFGMHLRNSIRGEALVLLRN
jgi:site-specific DNA-methyltransferase (cytosine-N4-specific)